MYNEIVDYCEYIYQAFRLERINSFTFWRTLMYISVDLKHTLNITVKQVDSKRFHEMEVNLKHNKLPKQYFINVFNN